MEEQFDQAGPDLSEEEGHNVKVIIRRIVQYDPENRPSPMELLLDPWLSEMEVGGSSFTTILE